MQIRYHRKLKKALDKQKPEIKKKLINKLETFVEDQFHYSLNNHALSGEFKGLRSINITGDIRLHYEEQNGVIILLNIGSHSELY